MRVVGVTAGLRLQRFAGEAGVVAFAPGTADTHLLGDAGSQLIEWIQQAGLPLDRAHLISGLVAESAPGADASASDVAALDLLLGDMLNAGLLVEFDL